MARIVPATRKWIERAAEIIRSGGLVAFPTETVYGLGANALDQDAVASIFTAKGRPSNNPIIVHVASPTELVRLTIEVNQFVGRLVDAFWPGPLTLVLPKSDVVPAIVTARGPTVGIRMPDHPIALDLITASGVPIAAPSANRSESVSPTRAGHVAESLGDAIDIILDGGQCDFGIESTVLDVTGDAPVILRPGAITAAQIAEVTGVEPTIESSALAGSVPLPSPGRMRRHYAPRASLLISVDAAADASKTDRSGLITHVSTPFTIAGAEVRVLPDTPEGYAHMLYASLRELDAAGVERIFVQTVPDGPEWLAVRDRLRRASEPSRNRAV